MSQEWIKGKSFLARKGIPKIGDCHASQEKVFQKSENVRLSVFLLLYDGTKR